jgi:CheY-like chemotaxis protein
MSDTQLLEFRSAELSPETRPQPAGTEGPDKPLALVVDDDQDFVDQQVSNLQTLGFEVLTAGGQSAARDILAQRQPDVAVVDLMMENPDAGFTLCYHLKQLYPETPVILVTSASSITGYDLESMHEGQWQWVHADAVFSKPMRLGQLRRELDRLLKG